MNPFDYAKTVTDFWTAQAQSLMQAQEQAGAAFVQGIKSVTSGKFPMLPEVPTDLSAGASDLAAAGKSVMDLWSAAATMCARLATTIPAVAGGDGVVEATFRKIIDARSWLGGTGEMDDVLGRMAQGPRFADLWEAERRYAGVLQAWMNLRRRGLEHNAVVLEAWLQAGRRFSEQLAGRSDPKTLDAKAALALWTETANQQLLETQRSEPFLRSQAAMIRATTELRMAQQELVEHFGKQYGFPTRTELDDVHRTVTELRREVRAMRREPRSAVPTAPQPEPAPPLARPAKVLPAAPPPVAVSPVAPPPLAAQAQVPPVAPPPVAAQLEATPLAPASAAAPPAAPISAAGRPAAHPVAPPSVEAPPVAPASAASPEASAKPPSDRRSGASQKATQP